MTHAYDCGIGSLDVLVPPIHDSVPNIALLRMIQVTGLFQAILEIVDVPL